MSEFIIYSYTLIDMYVKQQLRIFRGYIYLSFQVVYGPQFQRQCVAQ